jgi:hypothetical protein
MKKWNRLTLGLDVSVHDTRVVEISQTLQHLQGVDHNDRFVFDTSVLEQTSKRTARAIFHEDVHLVSVGLDTVIGHNVGVIQNL